MGSDATVGHGRLDRSGLGDVLLGSDHDAHAVLESSNPADQSVLATSPPKVTLTFGEAVTITGSAIRVYDGHGNRVDQGVATHDAIADKVEIGLRPDLPNGTYTIAWRVISADSHPVHGGLVFSVGTKGAVGGLDRYLTASSQPLWEAVGDALRAICYLTAFGVVGGVVFGAFAETDAARGAGGSAACSASWGSWRSCPQLRRSPSRRSLPPTWAWARCSGPGSPDRCSATGFR